MSHPALLDRDVLREGAGGGVIGRNVLVFRETASTNDLLLRMGENGEPEGLVIFAERQTSGRGRFRRPWHSADGLGLWFSFLLRRDLPPARTTLLTSYVAVSLWEGLASFVGEGTLRIKPPNDIHGRHGKIAGILIEARTGPQAFAVVGIGINVNHQPEDFPAELRESASSLAIEAGKPLDRSAVASAVLLALNRRLDEITTETPPFLAVYAEQTALWGAPSPLQ